MTLEQAIKNCNKEIWDFDKESIKQHHEIGKWLSELQGYKDETPISRDFLIRNEFTERTNNNFFYYYDDIEIIAKCYSAEMNMWYIYIGFLDQTLSCESLIIHTVGQMRMFLAIMELGELVKQFK